MEIHSQRTYSRPAYVLAVGTEVDKQIARLDCGEMSMTTLNQTDSTTTHAAAEACKWCADSATGRPQFLDRDGVLCSLSGEPGILSHAYNDSWWPCLKFGVEMRCASVSASAAPTVGVKLERDEIGELINYNLKRLSNAPCDDAARTFRQRVQRLRAIYEN